MATTLKPTELKIGQPKAFDGERVNTERFISDCKLHLRINSKIYQESEQQIGFVLSFMSEGSAAIWKEAYLETIFDENNTEDFPNDVDELYTKITDFFKPINSVSTAIAAIGKLQQKGTAEQYVAEFQSLLVRTKDNHLETQRKWFLDELRPWLTSRVATNAIGKTKMEEYYQVAIVIDQLGKEDRGGNGSSGGSGGYYGNRGGGNYRPRRIRASNDGPNINSNRRLSDEERTRYIREGRCFACHQTGHIANQCPNRENRGPTRGRPNRVSQIRAMMQGLSAKERSELAEEAPNTAQPVNVPQNF
ncbi:hypothetical protein EUX98_g8947 [Antrodiella citrinella]|uniref:CCHC-type domain-containing protein n=1 Tax=Antrodiella citrinella TaxID=2447956 RepID=A0A4S4M0J3_9APHY|nr:hypothetical protein EUX98_g8947 [Antrodiella citrinella]